MKCGKNPQIKIVLPAVLIINIVMFAVTGVVSKAECASVKHIWEKQHAKTDSRGNLVWTTEPFVFEAGDSVRYIDFEQGSDSNNGTTKKTAWKHHPWDSKAGGRAASCTGVDTYVFKRGVCYRSTLRAKAAGRPGNPVRLTSDPSWGEGEAVICGSVKITSGWKKGAVNNDIPDRKKVWYKDLGFVPRNVWMVKGEKITRIPLARMPNWTVSDPEDVKKEWWFWDNPGHPYFNLTMKSEDGRHCFFSRTRTHPSHHQDSEACPQDSTCDTCK